MTNNQFMKIFHSIPLFRPENPLTKILRQKIFHPPTKILRPRIFHPSTKILRPKIFHPPTTLHLLTKNLRSTNLPILCLPPQNCRQQHLFPLIRQSWTLKALLPQLNPFLFSRPFQKSSYSSCCHRKTSICDTCSNLNTHLSFRPMKTTWKLHTT